MAPTTDTNANHGKSGNDAPPGVRSGQAATAKADSRGTHAAVRSDDTLSALRTQTVTDVMVHHPKLCPEDSLAGDVRELFTDDHVHAALIVSGTRLLTVIERADLGPQTADSLPGAQLGRLSGRVVAPTVTADAALRQMMATGRRRMAVVRPDMTLLGLLCLKRSGTGFCSDENVRQRLHVCLRDRVARHRR
jgi:hypothetical protein